MKKRILVQNSEHLQEKRKAQSADRAARLRSELRENLKKRKAQARAKTEASKDG